QVLDRFEAIAMASLFPLPTKAPESIEVRGNLSAQEGWEIARPLAYFQIPEAQLALALGREIEMQQLPKSLVRETVDLFAAWTFLFLTDGNESGVRAIVPNVGFASVAKFTPPRTFISSRVGEGWIDSSKGLEIAE